MRRKGVRVNTNAIASVDLEDDDPSISLIGRVILLPRVSPSLRPLWARTSEERATVDRPTWIAPPLWERPRTRLPESWAPPRELPVYKRTWRQLALF